MERNREGMWGQEKAQGSTEESSQKEWKQRVDCPGGGEQAGILKAGQGGRSWRHLGRSRWESAILDDEPWGCQAACCSRE